MTIKSLIFSGIIGGALLFTASGVKAQTIDDFESGNLQWTVSNSAGINVGVGINLTDPISGTRDLNLSTANVGAPNSNYTISRTGLGVARESINDRFSFKYRTLLAVALGKTVTVSLTGTETGNATPKIFTATQAVPVLSIGSTQTFNFLFSSFTPSAANLESLETVSIRFDTGLLNLSVNEQIDDIVLTRDTSNVNDWHLY